MNALYAQHFRKTDSCPNLEMRTFASDSKSEQKCTLEHTFSHKLPASSRRGSSGALSPSTKKNHGDGSCDHFPYATIFVLYRKRHQSVSIAAVHLHHVPVLAYRLF